MDPGVDVVTEKSNNVDHVDDLNNLKIQTTTKAEVIKTTTLTTTTTTSTTSRSKGMFFVPKYILMSQSVEIMVIYSITLLTKIS